MSIKLRRYQANESDFTKDGRSRATIDVPASVGFTDLTSSKLIMDMQLNVKQGANDVLLPATFGLDQQMVGPQAVIRNSKVVSMENGLMNEQRNSNVISANMDWYVKSRAAEDCGSLFGNSTNQNYGRNPRSRLPDNPFFDYRLPSSATPSVIADAQTRRAEVPVAWRHVDEFGNMAQFPNIGVGNLSYQIEFENQLDVVSPADMPAQQIEPCNDIQLAGGATTWGTALHPIVLTKTVSNHWKPPVSGQQVSLWYVQTTATGAPATRVKTAVRRITSVSVGGGLYILTTDVALTSGANDLVENIHISYYTPGCNTPYPCDDITPTANVIGDATHPLVISDMFSVDTDEAHKECAFYVGAPVCVVASDETADRVRLHETVVSRLTINGPDLEIELLVPFNVGGNNDQTEINIGYRTSLANTKFTVEWQIAELYAELHEIQLMPTQREAARKALGDLKLPFVSLYLKQRNMPETNSHSEVIQSDPNCLGLAVLTPQNLTLVSGFDRCTSYRFAINGKDQTNRPIPVGDENTVARQLHNYLIKRFYGNLGQRVMKYDAPTINYGAPDAQASHSMFPLVTPLVPEPLTIQLVLDADGPLPMESKNLFFVFAHSKTLMLSKGRAMVM